MSQLNSEQRNAFIDVLAFLNDPTRKMHRISGGAGTGKTFFISKVVGDILKHTNSDCPVSYVVITATTNKATSVLTDAMPHRRGDIETIYTFMNLRVASNFNDGTQKVIPTAKWTVHDRVFIIVDEASMVNKALMDYLMSGTTANCKILFVGDKNQLSPVGEKISPVYAREMTESLLTKPVRNAEQPALMDLCSQAVQTVITGVFTKIKEVPGVIDFVDGNQLQGLLEREYSTEDLSKRVLSYTNKRVIEYNTFIRETRGYVEPYNVGEILVNNTSAELADKTRLFTDQTVEILEVSEPYFNGDIVPGHDIPMLDLELEDPNTFSVYSVTVFADPEDRANVMSHYKGMKKWFQFYKVRDKFPDLRSVAASTTHKAQGSTYGSVIVDLADIGRSTNKEQTARMQYVALSRPKSRIYIRGELPARYFD